MTSRTLSDGEESFAVTVLQPAAGTAVRVVLFSVGAGGNPERHLPLLTALTEHGCTVVAPHFERFVSPRPTEDQLRLRARRLRLSLDAVAPAGLPVAGVGHSIGATMLLALAGGQVWMRAGEPLAIAVDARIDRLALLTPAVGFFRAPAALDAVRVPILAWAGSKDFITPASDVEWLPVALEGRAPIEVRVVEGAGHFSFMHVPPPQTMEPLADHAAFLAELTAEVCRFVIGSAKVAKQSFAKLKNA